MAIDSDIRDQAYQFFIQEAPELLAAIEAELLTVRTQRTTAKVHSLMRAAHSIKGGAACVGLDVIKTLAHRLEDIFKALHSEELEIDSELESMLLKGYDCLRLPLMQQLTMGHFEHELALASAEPVFTEIELRLGEFLGTEAGLPSAVELGIDITLSIFEVDVDQELERLSTILENPENIPLAGELRAQAEVFTGISELLSLPGLGAIAQTTLAALEANPDQAVQIAQLALADFRAAQQAVIAGDRTQGGSPSPALIQLASPTPTEFFLPEPTFLLELPSPEGLDFSSALDDFSGEFDLTSPLEELTTLDEIGSEDYAATGASEAGLEEQTILDEIGSEPVISTPPESVVAIVWVPQAETLTPILSVEEILAIAASKSKPQALSPECEMAPAQEIAVHPVEDLTELENTFIVTPSLEDIFSLPSSDTETFADSPLFEFESLDLPAVIAEETNPENVISTPSLEDIFGSPVSQGATVEISELIESLNATEFTPVEPIIAAEPASEETDLAPTITPVLTKVPESIADLVQSIEQVFDSLPPVKDMAVIQTPAETAFPSIPPVPKKPVTPEANESANVAANSPPNLSVRVDVERLERMNNLVGELAINRNGLSLQNEQLQGTVQELLRRFAKFQDMANHLRDLSDQMLVAPERYRLLQTLPTFADQRVGVQGNTRTTEYLAPNAPANSSASIPMYSSFDSLEMDSYGELHSLLQTTLEEVVQLEEIVGDVVLLAGQSSQTLEGQRQMLAHLRDDLMWARMLPLGEVLSRFPRTLRDLSTNYKKSVNLKLSGTGVLVDKAALEKLYDPLLHLLRNAFDHGIEQPAVRRQQGKSEQGQIEIRAYHQGSQTVIEVRDDGQGVNLKRVRDRAVELGLLSSTQVATTSNDRLLDFLFEPGFSTATQVSELSGRGVGLDVVRSQLRSLKGTVTVSSSPGRGTTFTLRIPLTLTISKLLVCLVGSTAYALPSDSIEEILIPKSDQLKKSGKQRFLHWRKQIVPVYHLSELLHYACPLPESIPSQALVAVPTPEEWAPPMLLIRQDQQFIALEIDRLVTEQELVIKPFGAAITPPNYIYGCTILGDGSLIPVIDSPTLMSQLLGLGKIKTSKLPDGFTSGVGKTDQPQAPINPIKSPLILVVDDSIALRQTLALTLQKVGHRVLQARDGREAIEQLQQNSNIQLVICDVEMPNMNGFEFLNHRRQDSLLSKIPVVMLTSRSSDKHKRLATHLGASAYFTKPYLEQEFLASLKTILDQEGSVGELALLSST